MPRALLLLSTWIAILCPPAMSQHLDPTPNSTTVSHRSLLATGNPYSTASISLAPLAPGDDQGSLALTIGSSVLFGTAGFFLGGVVGGAVADDCDYYDCLAGVIFGVLIGTPVGTAVGAHIGNGSRGSLGYDLLAGLGGSVVGTLILAASTDDQIAIILAGASVVALPVFAERHTAGRRARARRVDLTAAPTRHGFAVGLRLTMGS